jgi:hypothetical protein
VKRASPEADLQSLVVHHLRVRTIKPARFWFVPNGGNLSRPQAAKFQRMGLTPGIPDLHFMWSETDGSQDWAKMGFIELKAGKGTLSPWQKQFRDDAWANHHQWAECRSVDEVMKTLSEWGFPLRHAVMNGGKS